MPITAKPLSNVSCATAVDVTSRTTRIPTKPRISMQIDTPSKRTTLSVLVMVLLIYV